MVPELLGPHERKVILHVFWREILAKRTQVSDVAHGPLVTLCFKTTKDTSIQWMQYRLLHRILPVKYYLKKISVLPSDSCTFCDKEVETIQHVFIGCENVSSIWSSLSMHIYNTTSQRIGFNVVNILLGELPSSKGNKIINLIILYTKQYKFSCLKRANCPTF